MSKIVADFVGTEAREDYEAKLIDLGEYFFGPGSFATRGELRTLFNDLTDASHDWQSTTIESQFRQHLNWWNDTNRMLTDGIPDNEGAFVSDATLWQDVAGTTTADDPAEPVGRWDGQVYNLLQSSAGLRPTVVEHPVSGVRNRLNNTENFLVNWSLVSLATPVAVDAGDETLGWQFTVSVATGNAQVFQATATETGWMQIDYKQGTITNDVVFYLNNDNNDNRVQITAAGAFVLNGPAASNVFVTTLDDGWIRVKWLGSNTASGSKRVMVRTSNNAIGGTFFLRYPSFGETDGPYQRVGASSADVTEAGVEQVTGVRFDQTTQKMNFTVPGTGDMTGTMILAGPYGTWAETITTPRGVVRDLGPTTVSGATGGIMAAVCGPTTDPNNKLLGFLLYDRVLTDAEIRQVADRFKKIGGAGWLVLGPELVTNGNFDTDVASWGVRSGSLAWDSVNQRAEVTIGGADDGVKQTIAGVVVGELYKISLTAANGSTANRQYAVGLGPYPNQTTVLGLDSNSTGNAALFFKAAGQEFMARNANAGPVAGELHYYDSLSVRKIILEA